MKTRRGTQEADFLVADSMGERLLGLGGADTLLGEFGNDWLYGGRGRDILSGGRGDDILSGGRCSDTFVFTELDGSFDVIADFSHEERDRIDLSQIDANTKRDGDQRFTLIGAIAFTGKAGELRVDHIGDNTHRIQGDVDGDGSADFILQVQKDYGFEAGDFVF